MPKPNMVLQNLPKRPFECEGVLSNIIAADAAVEALRKLGWEAKHTAFVDIPAMKRRGQVIRPAVRKYRIWRREPIGGRAYGAQS
jgi:hypothetical protein